MISPLQDKIIDLLATITEDSTLPERVNSDTSIINDIGLDSLQLITFILTVEDEYSLEINFEGFDLEHLASIRAFCCFAEGLQTKASNKR